MGFLDTLGGQGRTGSPPPGSRRPVTQSVVRNDSTYVIQKPRAPEPPPSSSNDRIIASGAVLVVLAAVGVAAWLALRGPGPLRAPNTEVSADAASTAAPTETVIPKRRSARSMPAVRSPVKRKQTVDSGGSGDTATEAPVAAAAPTSDAAGLTEAATAPIQTISNLLEAPLVAAVPDDDNVYSGVGEGVVAPRLLSLGFGRRLVTGLRTRTSTIELVVSKSGDVERVKLFPPSRNWEDAMLLSRAKMFQFQPAQRNGFPVRYRFVMEVDAAP